MYTSLNARDSLIFDEIQNIICIHAYIYVCAVNGKEPDEYRLIIYMPSDH